MNTPTMNAVLEVALDARLAQVNTCMPASVTTFDMATQTCSVQPLLRCVYYDEAGARKTEPLPVINHVPVVYFGAGAFSDVFPLEKGDTVLLLFSQASIDRWSDRGGQVDPQDERRFHLSDAIALPGLRARAHASSETADGVRVIAGPEIRIGGASDTQPTIMADTFIDALVELFTPIVSGVDSAVSGAGGAASTAFTDFQAAVTSYKSARARVK